MTKYFKIGANNMKDILFINATPINELRMKINGTMILATKLIQAGYNVGILRFYEIESHNKGDYNRFINDITNRIISENPKCVSFYTLWPFYHIFLRIAKQLKVIDPNIVILMGGPQSSLTAYSTMNAMNCIDYISTGEGENIVVPLFDAILKNNNNGIEDIPGLYYRKNNEIYFCDKPIPLCDLDSIPHWDESLYLSDEKNMDGKNYYMPIDVGRGCPFNCTFCSTSVFWKRNYRLKSPEKILEDIIFFNKKFGIKSFRFSHDALTVNSTLISKLCDYIIESKLDITWACATRIDCISEQLILKMKEAGLRHIELGIETGSPNMQKITNKKLNLEKVTNIVDFLLENKIETILFFMYGFPEETEEDLNQTLNLYCDFADKKVNKLTMSFCTFNPATVITNKYFDKLEFDPNIKALYRDVFGFEEEKDMILNNKAIFPFYFNLNTPVRNNYQYLIYFATLYREYSKSLYFIRRLYKNNMLELYNDFYKNNKELFDYSATEISRKFVGNKVEILLKTIKNFDNEIIEHFKALLQFELDLQYVINSKEDIMIQKEYNFSYLEYIKKIPIEKFTNTTSKLVIEKAGKKVAVKILSL